MFLNVSEQICKSHSHNSTMQPRTRSFPCLDISGIARLGVLTIESSTLADSPRSPSFPKVLRTQPGSGLEARVREEEVSRAPFVESPVPYLGFSEGLGFKCKLEISNCTDQYSLTLRHILSP